MKKQLTDKDRQLLRKSLQKFSQNGTVIVYGLANKQSGSSLFSNQRLILLHSAQKSIRYYSKQPPGLPFTKLQQIPEGKSKVLIDKVTNFKCERVKGKTSTMKIQWEENKKTETWIFTFEKTPMMNQFVAAVEETINGGINKDPTFVNLPSSNVPGNANPSQNPNPSLIPNSNTNSKDNIPKQPVNSSINNLSPLLNSQNNSIQPSATNKQPDNIQTSQPALASNQTKSQAQLNKPSQINSQGQQIPPSSMGQTQPSSIGQTQPPKQPAHANQKPIPQPQRQAEPVQNQPNNSRNLGIPPSAPQNRTSYGDVSEEIRALREKDPKRFNLTNQLSKKNLHQQQPQFILSEPTDNIETRRDQPPAQNTEIRRQQQPSFMKPKPQPQAANPSNSRMTQNSQHISNPNPNQNSSQAIGQSRGYPPSQGGESQKNLNKNASIKYAANTPAHRSQYINEQPNQFNSQGRPMNRVQSQQQQLSTVKQRQPNNSRMKSEFSYDTNPHKNRNPSSKNLQLKKWNQIWCTSNKPIQIYQQFISECEKISMQIIDQLPFLKSHRQYHPIKQDGPYSLYNVNGISYNMHCFQEDADVLQSERDRDERAPLLFDHESYMEVKREFYNYNIVLAVTGNKGLVKIPLACFVEYKGVLMVCKANIPQWFQKVPSNHFQKYLQNLQQVLRMRFIFNSLTLYAQPQKKYLLLTDLGQLIPRIPMELHPPSYFRKQFLLEHNFFIEDQSSLHKLFQILINKNIKELISKFETFDTWVINSNDFIQELHRSGISAGCISLMYQETTLPYLKKVIVSQMTKNIFCDILRSELNSVYASIPTKQLEQITIQYIDKIVLDCTHVLIDQLFSYSSSSENIWRMIVKQVNKRYKIAVSKEDIIPGYLLGGIMGTLGINCEYKTPGLDRKQSFFVRENVIPRDMLLHFYPKVRRYDLETVYPLIGRVQDILASEPNPDNYEQIVRTLNLKNGQIPSYCQSIKSQILTYLCNFIPLGDHDQFDHLGIYDMLEAEPHTFCSTKISLLGIKWAAKKKNDQLANKLFQIKSEENAFWVCQFNPAISEFYDFFSLYNVSIGNYEQAVRLAKSSLVNSIKMTGANSLPVADKHYQLGNIFFKISKKQEALKQYLKTKQILEQHKQTSIPEYGVILLKLALLYLNFGKISDCVGSSLEALKIFDTNGGNQQEQIETFEILARSYEITRKTGDLASVGALCSQKFNNTENPKIFERMIKIVLLPKLASISHESAKTLLKLVNRLEELESPINYIDAFNYLHFRAQNEVVMKRLFIFIQNVSNLYEDVMRKDLLRKHKSLSHEGKSEAADMLMLLQAVLVMTGYNFVNGSLRDNYY